MHCSVTEVKHNYRQCFLFKFDVFFNPFHNWLEIEQLIMEDFRILRSYAHYQTYWREHNERLASPDHLSDSRFCCHWQLGLWTAYPPNHVSNPSTYCILVIHILSEYCAFLRPPGCLGVENVGGSTMRICGLQKAASKGISTSRGPHGKLQHWAIYRSCMKT